MRQRRQLDELTEFFGSPRLASALTVSAIGLSILAWPIHHVIGWACLIAMLATHVVLCIASALARRGSLDRTGVLPVSLLAFGAWVAMSTLWSQYQWATVGAIAYFVGFTVLGIYIALVRDTIQVIRSFGDVLRFVLVASLALEIFSGLLVDSPIGILGIDGFLSKGGPISGLVGNRNDLGLLAVIAGVSFVIEWRTKSIQRGLAIGSLVLATVALALTRSPIAWGTAVVAVLVLLALYGLRRVDLAARRYAQFGVLAFAVVIAVVLWQFRAVIITNLNATGELSYRLRLWSEVWSLVKLHLIEGWGWIGQWNSKIAPYTLFADSRRDADSAVNAYLDVAFQLGLTGLTLFLCLLGLAFVRSWLLASRQKSVVYTWPAVVLAALFAASIAESTILIEFGWMTFVICCVKASQTLSWRTAFRRPLEQEPLTS